MKNLKNFKYHGGDGADPKPIYAEVTDEEYAKMEPLLAKLFKKKQKPRIYSLISIC